MEYSIKNDGLEAKISDLGAELVSLRSVGGQSYLWDGNPQYWNGHALTLFPMIGRCKEDRYFYKGKSYPMGLHGLAMETKFRIAAQDEQRLVMEMTDTEATRKRYPFAFRFAVQFEVKGNTLSICYTVENRGRKTMHFAVGGHPGFMLPLENGIPFEAHYIEFGAGVEPEEVCIVPRCMVTGETRKLQLQNQRLYLRHTLFSESARILQQAGNQVKLSADGCGTEIKIEYPQMDYLGLWHTVNTDANFVCIEPWSSRPGAFDAVEEITKRTDLISLEPQKQCGRTVCISISETDIKPCDNPSD